jgi:uncharacterized damage-inducible protein DinB
MQMEGKFMSTAITRMFEHIDWANLEMLDALKLTHAKSEKALSLFIHILSAENVWLNRLNEIDTMDLQIWPKASLEHCEQLISANRQGYHKFLKELNDSDYSRLISYTNSKGVAFTTSIADILTHVSLHGSYHRGQINAMLRSEGYEPRNTDYITFSRLT